MLCRVRVENQVIANKLDNAIIYSKSLKTIMRDVTPVKECIKDSKACVFVFPEDISVPGWSAIKGHIGKTLKSNVTWGDKSVTIPTGGVDSVEDLKIVKLAKVKDKAVLTNEIISAIEQLELYEGLSIVFFHGAETYIDADALNNYILTINTSFTTSVTSASFGFLDSSKESLTLPSYTSVDEIEEGITQLTVGGKISTKTIEYLKDKYKLYTHDLSLSKLYNLNFNIHGFKWRT